jgi:acyl-CoA synthetase (AMP-forming)/AMP-acid ligase II
MTPKIGLNDFESPNIASRLTHWAKQDPHQVAVVEPNLRRRFLGKTGYEVTTFAELDRDSDLIAKGLLRWGIRPKMRLIMLVPFSSTFIRLTFATLKAGINVVLIDPGIGRKHLVNCLAMTEPDGFIGIPKAQVIRSLLRRRFKRATWNVTVGRRWGWGGISLDQVRKLGESSSHQNLPEIGSNDPAAIIFTSGSTGLPKGVAYTHANFQSQVDLIRNRYNILPGSRDLACFPLFGLFDNVMGVTTVIPDMDPTRPAAVVPERLFNAIYDWQVDQAFGSPALWHQVVKWCERSGKNLSPLRRILSAGAPVPADTLQKLKTFANREAQIMTPYGATEALPIASIEAREVIEETGLKTQRGFGVCVGTRFPEIQWKVIEIKDDPLPSIDMTRELPKGLIGELMVTGPVVTSRYVVREDQNYLHKVSDGERVWHRMGDVGYLDEQDRFWFCGRKSHRVTRGEETWFSVPCEAIFENHPDIYRAALIGVGDAGHQTPVIIVEPHKEKRPVNNLQRQRLANELLQLGTQTDSTAKITDIRIYPRSLPVDIRHNSKICREKLAAEINTFAANCKRRIR